MIIRTTYTIFFSLLCVLITFGQATSVTASIDRNAILIGEPITLLLEATVPLSAEASWFALDSIPHFEFIEKGKVDSAKDDESRYFKQEVRITSFDSGRWSIPPLPMDINGRSYLTDSLVVSVSFTPFDPNQEYHDIKDILEVENPAVRYINWVLLIVTILSLLAVIWFLRRARVSRQPPAPVASSLDPYREALAMLENLQAQQLPEKGQVKVYYTGLNDVIRHFIFRKTGLPTMEKTNDELLLQIRRLGMKHEDTLPLAQTLRMSDAVKFAKYVPQPADNQQSYQQIRSSVDILNNINTSAV
jgi:hypothetical protein